MIKKGEGIKTKESGKRTFYWGRRRKVVGVSSVVYTKVMILLFRVSSYTGCSPSSCMRLWRNCLTVAFFLCMLARTWLTWWCQCSLWFKSVSDRSWLDRCRADVTDMGGQAFAIGSSIQCQLQQHASCLLARGWVKKSACSFLEKRGLRWISHSCEACELGGSIRGGSEGPYETSREAAARQCAAPLPVVIEFGAS